ncbi:MAG: LptE family protein [Candidatus Omnitrophota bacterium]|nr:LptE family protein [Candidatus Omnitrophota bacterium]
MNHRFIILFSVFCFLFSSAGCGYTTRSNIATTIKTIYIEPFKNKIDFTSEFSEARNIKTYFPLLETKITQTVVDRFIFDGNIKVVKKDKADVILKGELTDYIRDTLRYDDNNNVEEYRLNLVVNMSLWKKDEDKVIWSEPRFVGQATYFTSGSQAKSEAVALNDALTDLARRIVERAVEQW